MKSIIITIFIFSVSITTVLAQNMTNSPASMYGIGELATGEGGQYAGMGGVGISLRADNFLNLTNPASLTELKQDHFIVDVGIKGSYQHYSQSGRKANSVMGNLNNFSIGARLTPRLYAAFFLAPLSSVGYAIKTKQDVSGIYNGTTDSYFEGEGGLSKIGLSAAFKLWQGLSIGTNVSYATGIISNKETSGSATDKYSSRKYAFYADFGLQYKHKIDRERNFVVGLTYGHSQDFVQDNDHIVSSSSTGDYIDERARKNHTCLPQFMGGGVSYNTLQYTLAAEYKYVDWGRMVSSKSNVSFRNQHDLRLGGSYLIGSPYRAPIRLLAGAGFGNSYLVIQQQKPYNYYVSMGVNCELFNKSTVSVGVKYNDQLNVSAGRFKEQSFSLFLNVSLSERSYRAKLK